MPKWMKGLVAAAIVLGLLQLLYVNVQWRRQAAILSDSVAVLDSLTLVQQAQEVDARVQIEVSLKRVGHLEDSIQVLEARKPIIRVRLQHDTAARDSVNTLLTLVDLQDAQLRMKDSQLHEFRTVVIPKKDLLISQKDMLWRGERSLRQKYQMLVESKASLVVPGPKKFFVVAGITVMKDTEFKTRKGLGVTFGVSLF